METPSEYQLSDEDVAKIKRAIIEEITSHPPTVGIIGVSGTGKSSTINSMFKTDLAISHVVACTKEFKDTNLRVSVKSGEAKGQDALLRIVDAPGLGEDITLDPTYLNMYRERLADCDVILWVLAARNRAVALDQIYLKQLSEFNERMVFGINQVDLIEPMDWNQKINLPSREQERNIQLIVNDRKLKVESVIGHEVKIVPYSATHKYNLQELFTMMIESAPKKRAWIFSAIKAFSHEDFLPEAAREKVMQILDKERKSKKKGWF